MSSHFCVRQFRCILSARSSTLGKVSCDNHSDYGACLAIEAFARRLSCTYRCESYVQGRKRLSSCPGVCDCSGKVLFRQRINHIDVYMRRGFEVGLSRDRGHVKIADAVTFYPARCMRKLCCSMLLPQRRCKNVSCAATSLNCGTANSYEVQCHVRLALA